MEHELQFSILIVDDEASNLHILNQILKPHYTIYAARTGSMALALAASKKPDLILLDVILPDINGYDVLTQLKGSDATRDIPVIFISGLSGIEHEEKGLGLGAVGYITKPFNSQAVKENVQGQFIV